LYSLRVFADLVADDATDRCTADSSGRAAARKHGTTNGAANASFSNSSYKKPHAWQATAYD